MIRFSLVLLFACCLPLSAAVDFVRDVKPIFDRSCAGCHGDKQQLGQLRLDARAIVLEGGVSGKTVTPGEPEKSELYLRVAGTSEHPRMPMGGELPVQEWSTTWVDGDGRLGTITTQSMQVGELGGERHRVQFLDASDAVVSEAEAHFYPTDHLPGGILAWPAAPARSRTVDIEGFGRLAID